MRNLMLVMLLTFSLAPIVKTQRIYPQIRQTADDSWLTKITSEITSSFNIIKEKFSFANCYYDKSYNLYENGTVVRKLTEAEMEQAQQYQRDVDEWKTSLLTSVGNFSGQVTDLANSNLQNVSMSDTLTKLPKQPCFCSVC